MVDLEYFQMKEKSDIIKGHARDFHVCVSENGLG